MTMAWRRFLPHTENEQRGRIQDLPEGEANPKGGGGGANVLFGHFFS